MYSVKEILWYYRQHGIKSTVARIRNEISIFVYAILFGLLERRRRSEPNQISVIPRSGTIDQDTTAIICQNDKNHNKKLYIAVDSVLKEQDRNQKLLSNADQVELIKIHSLRCVEVLADSEFVITKDRMWQYRLLRDRSTKFVRIPHGIPAKNPQVLPDTSCGLTDLLPAVFDLHKNFYYTVASEMELYREMSVMGRTKSNLAQYGYPRYDRIRHLVDNPDDTMLGDETRSILESSENHYKILYAPTHKDNVYGTTLFPFPDKDVGKLRTFLSENNIRIFIRLHVREEDSGIAEEYIDGETILYAGNEISGSAAEMMPYFDALVTDYSSIFLDYILFDKPIFFVQDDIDVFRGLRGFAFDYDTYWPGPKIKTQDQFLRILTDILLQENDLYSYERQFVRDIFHPSKSEGFLENILEST